MSEKRGGGRGRPSGHEEPPAAASRLLEARRGVLERGGGACSVSEAAAVLGTTGTTEEDVRGRVSAGRPIALEAEDGTLQVPSVQFVAGSVIRGLEEVLAAMNVHSPWVRLQLLVDDDVLGALREGKIDEAVMAARSYLAR